MPAGLDGWSFHPSVVIGLVLLGGLYAHLGGVRAPRRRVVAFGSSLLVLFGSLNGPLHDLSDRSLFSAHMVQHLVLTLAFPPLFLYGLPGWVVRRVLRWSWLRRLGRALTRPIVAAGVFTAPIGLWHIPAFYEAAMRNHNLHILQHLVFLAASVIMWWPVLSPLPELPRLSYPGQMLYLFLMTIPMSLTSVSIAYAGSILYPVYASAPRVMHLSPLEDQMLGGLTMWIPGGLY